MATIHGKARCITCEKLKSTVRCDGCSQPFCYNHLGIHRQELSKQLDEIEVTRDLFRQTLIELTSAPQKHPFIKQIDEWERESIDKIRQTADEARQLLLKYTARHFIEMEFNLNTLSNQLRESRQEDNFFETDLQQWNEQLILLKEELNNPSTIKIRHESTPLVNKVSVDVFVPLFMPDIATDAKWTQYGVRLGRSNGSGNELNQLNFPNAVYINDDQIIYIVDSGNHRILEWTSGATTDQVVVGANGQGDRDNQLNHPTDVIVDKKSDSLIVCDGGNRRVMRWPRQNGTSGEIIISNIDCYGMTMDNNGYLYVSDRSRHEVRRWKIGETNGTLVAGSNGQGNRLDQLSAPTYIFVDQDQSLYVSDQNNHRVVKWMKGAKEGIVVAGGQSQGNSLKQLNYPRGIAIDQLDTVYVADYYNHRVMRWCKGATQGSLVVGGNEKGEEANQLNGPWGLSFDQQGHLYVADYNNHRVQKFHIDLRSTL